MAEQEPFSPNQFESDDDLQHVFAENPEPRCPCIVLMDVSYSMTGRPIKELQKGLEILKKSVEQDSLASKRVELAFVTFGMGVSVLQDFATVDSMQIPTLEANGATPMGQAICKALDMVESRKSDYKRNGIPYYQPWIFLITDGEPTDYRTPHWNDAIQRVNDGTQTRKLAFFSAAVENANLSILSEIGNRDPLKLKGLNFGDLFVWLSSSLQSVSASGLGDKVPLQDPTSGPNGWAEV
jgi:uncharacterized protein YegL